MAAESPKSFVAALAAKYGQRLRRFLSIRTRNAADVPDLAQEVFLRLMRVEQHEIIRSPEAYLFTVASHVVHQHTLRESSAPKVVEITEVLAELQLTSTDDPSVLTAQGIKPYPGAPEFLAIAMTATAHAATVLACFSSGGWKTLSQGEDQYGSFGEHRGFAFGKGGFAFAHEALSAPPELWFAPNFSSAAQRITQVHRDFQRYALGSARRIRFINGWGSSQEIALLLPPDFAPGKRYPVVVTSYPKDLAAAHLAEFGFKSSNYRDFLERCIAWLDEFADISRDANGNLIFEGERVRSRHRAGALKSVRGLRQAARETVQPPPRPTIAP